MAVINVNQARRFFDQAQHRASAQYGAQQVQGLLERRQERNVPSGGFSSAISAGAQSSRSPTFRNVLEYAPTALRRELFQGGKFLPHGIVPIASKAALFTPAISIASTGRVGAFAKIGRGAKTLFQRATGNPLASGGLKGWFGRIGGRALGYGAAIEAFQFQRARASGKEFDWLPNVGSIAAFAINPVAAFAGTALGGGEKGVAFAGDVAEKFFAQPMPSLPQQFGFDQGDTIFNFPSGEAPSQPMSAAYAPSVQISGGLGGGGMDLQTLALMLGIPLSVLLGYGLGKKRKRKKYKRGKRK